MTDAPSTSTYVLVDSDTNLPNSRRLMTNYGLDLINDGTNIVVNPTQELDALLNLTENGFVVRNVEGSVVSRLLISNGSLDILNSSGVDGDPIFIVNDETTFQKINILEGGTQKSQRATVNYIAGPNIGISVVDNGAGPDGFSGQTDITISATSGGAISTASYITLNNERPALPGSVRLVAGDNISFTSATGTLTINSDGGGGGGGGASVNATYWTITDETSILPNSKLLTEGPGILIDPTQGKIQWNYAIGLGMSITADENNAMLLAPKLTAGAGITITQGTSNDLVIAATGGGDAPANASYLTLNNETSSLPNSYQVQNSNNVRLGKGALQNITPTAGDNNFGAGHDAGRNLASGANNVFVGAGSGNSTTGISTYNNAILIGAIADCSVDNLTNVIAIGQASKVGSSNTCVLGNSSLVSVVVGNTTNANAPGAGLILDYNSSNPFKPQIYYNASLTSEQVISLTAQGGVITCISDSDSASKPYFQGTSYTSGSVIASTGRSGTLITGRSIYQTNGNATVGTATFGGSGNTAKCIVYTSAVRIATNPSGLKYAKNCFFDVVLLKGSAPAQSAYTQTPVYGITYYIDLSDADSVDQQSFVIILQAPSGVNIPDGTLLQWKLTLV